MTSPDLICLEKFSVAKGVAIGLFFAFLPLPMQMLLAVIGAVAWRGNMLIAALMTWITNPFTLLPITYGIYRVGCWVMDKQTAFASTRSWHSLVAHFSAADSGLSQLKILFNQLGKPFLIGLPLVAISTAIIGYLLVLIIWPVVARSKDGGSSATRTRDQ